METDNIIDRFIPLPASYKPYVFTDPGSQPLSASCGQPCVYAFKHTDAIYYGNGPSLAARLQSTLKNQALSSATRKLVDKFMNKFPDREKAVVLAVTRKISIIIICDHQLLREWYKTSLNSNSAFKVIFDSGDGKTAVDVVLEKRPDIVLLDINMTPLSGFDVLKRIKKNFTGCRVIGISEHAQSAYAKKMLRLGAKGYVTKNSPVEEMQDAIMAVNRGDFYICEKVKTVLVDQMIIEEISPDINMLSDREMQIVRAIKEGLSSRDIATRLDVSFKTVEVHQQNILKKMKLKNFASLIKLDIPALIKNSDTNK